MKMCDEMVKLRAELDKRGIKWEDKSVITPEEIRQKLKAEGYGTCYDPTIYRTHFTVDDYFYSVIYGYGTYSGYDPISGKSGELLECMTEKLNGGEPVGGMTAIDVIRLFDNELDERWTKAENEVRITADMAKKKIMSISNIREIDKTELMKMFERYMKE